MSQKKQRGVRRRNGRKVTRLKRRIAGSKIWETADLLALALADGPATATELVGRAGIQGEYARQHANDALFRLSLDKRAHRTAGVRNRGVVWAAGPAPSVEPTAEKTERAAPRTIDVFGDVIKTAPPPKPALRALARYLIVQVDDAPPRVLPGEESATFSVGGHVVRVQRWIGGAE